MAINKAWLKKYGLVKRRSGGYRFENDAHDQKHEEDSWDSWDRGVGEANSCCGIGEISGLSNATTSTIDNTVIDGLRDYNGLIYYSISPRTTRRLKHIGFEQVGRFRNRNQHDHDQPITVLFLKV